MNKVNQRTRAVLFSILSALGFACPLPALALALELICPCSVTTVSQSAVRVSLGARSISEAAPLGPVIAQLFARRENNWFLLGERDLGELPDQNRTFTIDFLMGFSVPPDGSYDVFLRLLGQDDGTLYQVPLADSILLRREGGSSDAAKGSVFYSQDPQVSATENEVTVLFPELINTGTATLNNLSLRLIGADGPDIFGTSFFELSETPLAESLEPGSALGDVSFSATFTPPRAGFDFYHLQLRSGNATVAWRTVFVRGGAVPARSFSRSELDRLTDSDGDGASDYAEGILGTDPLSDRELPPPSRPKVLFLYGERVLQFYGSPSAVANRVAHVVGVANQALADSDVPMAFEIAGLEPLSPSTTARNADLLEAMADADLGFENRPTLQDRSRADYVVYLDIHDEGDSCGIAYVNGLNSHGDLRDSLPFSVVDLDCRSLVLAHEFGHNLGLGHSRTEEETGTFSWSVGHGKEGSFNTLMVSVGVFNAPELVRFSSPGLLCTEDGQPCGVAASDAFRGADAARTLRAVRFQAARLTNSPAPVLTLQGDNPLTLQQGESFLEPGFTATDDPDGDLSARVTISGTVTTTTPGTYRLRYRVVDSDGNSVEAERVVIVDAGAGDRDGDGVPDTEDAFPDDPTESADFDGDGLGDRVDTDDDGDGFTDEEEAIAGSDSRDASDSPLRGLSPYILGRLLQLLQAPPR